MTRLNPEERQERRAASQRRYREKLRAKYRAAKGYRMKPEHREHLRQLQLAWWTPERRRQASEVAKQRHRERNLIDAEMLAQHEDWEYCELPRWSKPHDQPPSLTPAELEWELIQTHGVDWVERWLRRKARAQK